MPKFQNPNLRAQSTSNGGAPQILLALIFLIVLALVRIEHFKQNPATQSTAAVIASSGSHAITGEKNSKLEAEDQHTWISVIANPLYRLLRALHGRLGPGAYNWGWAIILLTVIINLSLLPPRLAMMRSSLRQMRLQPRVRAIQKMYAHLKMNDPQKAKMQAEVMAIYKSEGVNMFGGCLPMLIPMPLLYAMYHVLANAGELRQAHWYWLFDLASPDPRHILPIFILVSMLLTQIITPQPGKDRTQRFMMIVLVPVIMGFTMWRLSSGLSLYWATGNLIFLGFQLCINCSQVGREMRALAAARLN